MMNQTAVTKDEPIQILDKLVKMSPKIKKRAKEMESLRRIPDDLFQELKNAGLFRSLVPKSYGGSGHDLIVAMKILETLAEADGAIAWTMMIGIESPELLSLLPRETFDQIYAAGPDVTVGGAFYGDGKAEKVAGGYQVSGRWGFVSGCQLWDYLFVNCPVVENGQVKEGPDSSLAMLLPAHQVTIEDTWHTMGLRATGSHHITVDNVFVPEKYAFNIRMGRPCIPDIYKYPFILWAFHITSIAIGVAQGALNETIEIVKTKQRRSMRTTLGQTPLIQHRLGRCETALRACREFLYAEAERVLAEVDELDYMGTVATIYANDAWIAHTCAEVVTTCFNISGASSIYENAPLQRRLRDIHTVTQHASLNDNSITRYGRYLMGEQVDMFF